LKIKVTKTVVISFLLHMSQFVTQKAFHFKSPQNFQHASGSIHRGRRCYFLVKL